MKALKRISDVLFLLSIALLVAAVLTDSTLLYVLGGFFLIDAFVATALKRKRAKAAKATKATRA